MDARGRRPGARSGARQGPAAFAGADIVRDSRFAHGLAFTGALLFLAGLGDRIVTPLERGDADAARERLAQVPLLTQTLKFTEPESDAWKRLTKAWGPPAFVVTVELARNEQGCWEDFHLDVISPVTLQPVSQPLPGHVNECAGRVLGLAFQATAADFAITVPEHANFPPADLVILPVWPDMQRRLGDAYVDERLAVIARWLMGAGAVLALAGAAGVRTFRRA
jgi:hypothetical protein